MVRYGELRRGFLGRPLARSLRTCLISELVSCELVRVVPDVIDVPVFPSSVITLLCDVSPCRSDGEFVEPQSSSFSPKSVHIRCTDTQEEMRYEGYTSA